MFISNNSNQAGINCITGELQQFRSEQSPILAGQQTIKDALANFGEQQLKLDGRQRELEQNGWKRASTPE